LLQPHKSETRISAIAHFSRRLKREKKALPLFPPITANGVAGHGNDAPMPTCGRRDRTPAYEAVAGAGVNFSATPFMQ
jgi:hypothetical protein